MADKTSKQVFRPIAVVSRAGYRSAESPVRIMVNQTWREVAEIMQRWRDPEYDYIRIRLDDGTRCVLRHTLDVDDWELAESS